MAYQQITGPGAWVGFDPYHASLVINGAFTSSVIDATGEKFAPQFAGKRYVVVIRGLHFSSLLGGSFDVQRVQYAN